MARFRATALAAIAASLLLQCGRGPRPTPEPPLAARAVSPPAAGIPFTGASPSGPVATATTPVVPLEPPSHTVIDPTFDAFSARFHVRCDPKQPGETTAEMVAAATSSVECLRARVTSSFEKLPDEVREIAFSPAWERLVHGVCGLDDAATWIGEVSRQAGTLRYVDGAGCSIPSLVEAAYLFDRMKAPLGAKAFARRVRATEAPGRARLDALPSLRASLVRLQHMAHEDALFDDECFYCKLSDSDWRRLTLELDAVAEQSGVLARAVCGSWPDLVAELGGSARCAVAVRAHFAWYVDQVPTPFGDGIGANAYAGYPPPKDPSYRAYVEPLIDTCRAGGSLRYSSDDFEDKVLRCIRSVVPSRADQAEVRQAIDAYVAHVCPVEQRIVRADIGPTTDVHQRLMDDRVQTIECPMLGAERRGYALWAWASGDAKGFARHVRARRSWARRVRIGSARVRHVAADKPCADYSEVFGGSCRSPALSASEWSALAGDVAALPGQAAAVASLLCSGWPALGLELGADRCAATLTDYFLSYPVFLGLAALGANR